MSLDPSNLNYVSEYYYLDNLSINLVEIDKNESYSNQLADSIEISSDEKVFNIKIKEAFYSNGEKITANDVIDSLKRGVIFGTPHFDSRNLYVGAKNLKSFDENIEGLKVINKDQLQITLNHPAKELFYYLNLTDTAIIHPSVVKKKDLKAEDWLKVTSGPYRLAYSKKGVATLVANEKSFLFNESMPKLVMFDDTPLSQLIPELKKDETLFGNISFKDYLEISDKVPTLKDVNFFGNNTDGILTLSLNVQNPKFKKEKTRQWINKKIINHFKIKENEQKIMRKAYQYFVPNARGYITDAKVLNYLDRDIDENSIPEEIKRGITISTTQGMKNYIPTDLAERLSSILNIPVKIDFSTPRGDYSKVVKAKKYESFIMATSMSYKVIGETLNLKYMGESTLADDPSGKIIPMLEKYQSLDNQSEENEIIKNILEQITKDSELVPLFYFGLPYFYNKKKIDISKMYLDESIEFWKMNVK